LQSRWKFRRNCGAIRCVPTCAETVQLAPKRDALSDEAQLPLASRITAVFDRIAIVDDKERRQFERAVRRAALFSKGKH
jgi:hypothetical protein